MSTSPTDPDDRLGQAAQSSPCVKDEGLLRALSSVPDVPFADAARRAVDRQSSDQAQSATSSAPPPCPHPQAGEDGLVAGDRNVRWPHTTISVLPDDQQIRQLRRGNGLPPRGSIRVVPNRGHVGPGMPTPMLRRPGYALPGVRKLLVTSAIAAMLAGAVVVEVLDVVGDSDRAGLPWLASRTAPLPQAGPPSTGFAGATTGSEAESTDRSVSMEPNLSFPPVARTENQAVGTRIEATLPVIVPDSEYEKIVGRTAALAERPAIVTPELSPISRPAPSAISTPELTPISRPERPAVATPELTPISRPDPSAISPPQVSPIARFEPTPITAPEPHSVTTSKPTPIARLEPMPQSPPIVQPLHLGKGVVADRAGFIFADSDVRYLTHAELQSLSAERLHLARNEIFARRGRYFKDDALRAYFSRFSWYRPRAWYVPLSQVEVANVELIQSIEEPALSRSITTPLPPHTKAENSVVFLDPGSRYLTPEELQGLSADQLAVVRNEIFARRGRYFKDDALRAYFSRFPWYQPHAWAVPLSPIEQANVRLVQTLEQTASTPRPASRAGRALPEVNSFP